MNRVVSGFLVLVLCGLCRAQAQPVHKVLRVGSFVVAPLMLGGPTAQVRGALPAFIKKEIAPALDIEFVWLPPMSFARAMASLRHGSIDILLLVSSPRDTTPDIGRFNWAYLNTIPQIAVTKDSPLQKISSPDMLAGMDIGWVGGSELPLEFQGIPIKWQLLFDPEWQTLNLRKLKAGRIQGAFYGNQFSPAYLARKEGIDIRLLPLPMPAQPFDMAYSLKADRALIAQFDAVAAKAFKGDRFRKFVEAYSAD